MKFCSRQKLLFIGINLLVALLLLIGDGYWVLSWLNDYTSHGKSIYVPAFQGLNVEEAEVLAGKNTLRVLVIDSLYDPHAKPGSILEQYPLNGAKVKANRMIHLTVNAHSPEQIQFPQLNNASYRQTVQTLETRGFRTGVIEYAPSDFKNLVLLLKYKGEEILPGSLLPKGAVIDLVLGDGNNGDNYVPTPRLEGKTLREALKILKENYLNIGQITPDASIPANTDYSLSIVYQQEPSFDLQTNTPAGTYINLFLTQDKKRIEALDSLFVTE